MDDYWKEVENITSSGGEAAKGEGGGGEGGEGETQEEQQKIPEGKIHRVPRIDPRETHTSPFSFHPAVDRLYFLFLIYRVVAEFDHRQVWACVSRQWAAERRQCTVKKGSMEKGNDPEKRL